MNEQQCKWTNLNEFNKWKKELMHLMQWWCIDGILITKCIDECIDDALTNALTMDWWFVGEGIDNVLTKHWWCIDGLPWWFNDEYTDEYIGDALINALTMHWWWKEELNERNWCIWCNECIDDVLHDARCIDDAVINALIVHWWMHSWCIDEIFE